MPDMNRSDIADAAAPADDRAQAGQRIRLLSYNVQAGISTAKYRHYVTHSWKHVLPHPQRFINLDRVARLVSDYDVIGLQEVDAGSLRSGYVNLTQYISERAGLPFWYDQTNRRIGRIAEHLVKVLHNYLFCHRSTFICIGTWPWARSSIRTPGSASRPIDAM